MRQSSYWDVPRIWPSATVFIIGGGPSILKQDLSLIHDRRVIGVNQAYKLGPWVDVCWFGDKGWYGENIPKIYEYGGLIATCSAEVKEQRKERVKYLGRAKSSGIESVRTGYVAWNGNSGASAINLAYWLGAKTVVLLGFDMQNPVEKGDKQTHWHNDYEPRYDKKTGSFTNPYPRFMRYWPQVKKDADAIGLRIINATIGGALEIFERMTLEEACRDL